jgi:hypothetical protein
MTRWLFLLLFTLPLFAAENSFNVTVVDVLFPQRIAVVKSVALGGSIAVKLDASPLPFSEHIGKAEGIQVTFGCSGLHDGDKMQAHRGAKMVYRGKEYSVFTWKGFRLKENTIKVIDPPKSDSEPGFITAELVFLVNLDGKDVEYPVKAGLTTLEPHDGHHFKGLQPGEKIKVWFENRDNYGLRIVLLMYPDDDRDLWSRALQSIVSSFVSIVPQPTTSAPHPTVAAAKQ